MRFLRMFKFKDVEIFQFRSKKNKGYAFILDLKRKMRYTDLLPNNYFDNEEEFLREVRDNYVKVVIFSVEQFLPEDKEDAEFFFMQLLDWSCSRNWDMEFKILDQDDVVSLREGDVITGENVYNYLREQAKKYGVEIPEIEVNRKTMSYLSQD